jgi:hypothetical protein
MCCCNSLRGTKFGGEVGVEGEDRDIEREREREKGMLNNTWSSRENVANFLEKRNDRFVMRQECQSSSVCNFSSHAIVSVFHKATRRHYTKCRVTAKIAEKFTKPSEH